LTATLLEQGTLRKELRSFAAFLETVRYIHLVPQIMREPDRSASVRHDPFGAGIIERIAATPEKSQHARLGWILEALQAAVPRLMQLEARRDAHGRPHLRALYEHWRPRGAWQSEDQFADGALRLIGILWSAIEGSGPLLIEEPEISLHPEIVRLIPRMLARLARRTGRQLILTTHSLDLLCGEGVGTEEILLLNPREESTSVRAALDLKQTADLLDRGVADTGADPQMALFGE
jgi:predicted ATPase